MKCLPNNFFPILTWQLKVWEGNNLHKSRFSSKVLSINAETMISFEVENDFYFDLHYILMHVL